MRAGYKTAPGKAALKLADRDDIRAEINRCAEQAGFRQEVAAGLRRLAFGRGTDALRLLRPEETPNVETLDLFNVSEIKQAKNGGLEIKFFDRQKALEKLAELAQATDEGAQPFYQALERSGRCISGSMMGQSDVH